LIIVQQVCIAVLYDVPAVAILFLFADVF